MVGHNEKDFCFLDDGNFVVKLDSPGLFLVNYLKTNTIDEGLDGDVPNFITWGDLDHCQMIAKVK